MIKSFYNAKLFNKSIKKRGKVQAANLIRIKVKVK